ncbi:MAG: hypothetical protein HQK54_10535 [Oligoflexales bacterium]|nr:hypothetical protein [Oligoflexales bacterium]
MIGNVSGISQAAGKVPAEKMMPVKVSDSEKFQALVNDKSSSGIQTGQETGLGDTILEGIQDIKNGYDHKLEKIDSSLSSEKQMDIATILKIQLDMTKLMIQGELINKTASQMTNNVDTLLKSQ